MCKKKQDNNWPVPAHMNDENWLKTMESWKGTWRDDYRIMNQEMYLKDRELIYMKFNPSICFEDYRQCEFCGDIFYEDPDNLLNTESRFLVRGFVKSVTMISNLILIGR